MAWSGRLFGVTWVITAAALYGCSTSVIIGGASAGGGEPRPTPTGDLVWAHSFGESYSEAAGSITSDEEGNIIVSGAFGGSLDLGGGPLSAIDSDGFLAKLDPSGKHLWSRALGDAAHSVTAQVRAGAGGELYLAGVESFAPLGLDAGPPPAPVVFLAKLDPSGNEIWRKPLIAEDGYIDSASIEVDPRGGFVLSGGWHGTLDLGDGPAVSEPAGTPFVASFDAAGALRWRRVFPKSAATFGLAVAVAPSGDVAVSGGFSGSVAFGGDVLTSEGIDDVFVLDLDADGGVRWSRRFGTASQDFAAGLAMGPDGEVLVIGEFSDGVDFGGGPLPGSTGVHDAIALLEPDGALRWATDAHTLLGGGSWAGPRFDAYGDVVLGAMSSTTDDPRLTLIELDGAGTALWQHTYGQHGEIAHPVLEVARDGSVLLTAVLWGTVDIGSGPLTNGGNGNDVLVAKFAP